VPGIVARLRELGVSVPIIGDFHYNGHLLLTKFPDAARLLDKYRINPGNVGAKRRDEHFATIVEVAITDVSCPDGSVPVLGRTEIVTRGQQVPLPFRVEYDEAAVEADHRYQAQVRVRVGGRLRWTNDTAVQVLAGGPSVGIVVVVVPVR
jgi:hypothetical protein